MQNPDRTRFIELLGRLGAESDEAVLAAARELHRSVKDSGLDWEELLRPDDAADPASQITQAVGVGEDAQRAGDGAAEQSGDMKIVDRLLARKDLSDATRSDLNEFKRNIREGKLDKMDADYIRALAKRLGA